MNSETIITQIALKTIQIEQEALGYLSESLDGDFVKAVQFIFNSRGRLVITGIGKSALVAQKIVATLNSTGSSAVFMHAADAVHGDLGMIGKDDILWCISKSGDTSEIKILVPLVKQFGNKVIGCTSNPMSFLATEADFFIHIPIDKEADPNNLAPTASTTSQMVMGDAIAMSLLALRGFSPKDFSKFHPGGSLGKQMYLKVNEVYPKNGQPFVKKNEDLKQVILSMTNSRLGITVVLDERNNVMGVVTDGDLRRMLEKSNKIDGITASQIMTTSPRTIHHDSMAAEALNLMRENSITQLVVVDDEEYVGIIHLHDLLKEGII